MSSSGFYDNLEIRPEIPGNDPLERMLNHFAQDQKLIRDDLEVALESVEQQQVQFNIAAPHIQHNAQIANMNPFAPPMNQLAIHPVQGFINSQAELTNAINNAKKTLVYINLIKRSRGYE
jgi:hypothetical protein